MMTKMDFVDQNSRIKASVHGDCNSCGVANCPGANHIAFMHTCDLHQPPKQGFSMAELAIAHPQSLHDALSALPFMVNLRGATRLLK